MMLSATPIGRQWEWLVYREEVAYMTEQMNQNREYRVRFIWAYLALFVFSLALIFWIIPWQVPSSSYGEVLTPRFFPYCVGILIALFSLILFIRGINERRPSAAAAYAEFPRPFWMKIGIHMSAFFVYLLLISLIGYATASFLALLLFLRLSGIRSWLKAVIVSFVTVGILYIGLSQGLSVQFPKGFIF